MAFVRSDAGTVANRLTAPVASGRNRKLDQWEIKMPGGGRASTKEDTHITPNNSQNETSCNGAGPPVLAAALEYAEQGLRVIPLHAPDDTSVDERARGKKPIGRFVRNGVKNATTDPKTIRKWWAKEPTANVGIATGIASGVVVLDVDGPKGEDSLRALEATHGPLPSTLTVVTGRKEGGRHLYFRCAEPVPGAQGRLGLGLDVKGDGGYVVGPPSEHQSGAIYRFAHGGDFDCQGLADCPLWLVELLRAEKSREPEDTQKTHGYLKLCNSVTNGGLHSVTNRSTPASTNDEIKKYDHDYILQNSAVIDAIQRTLPRRQGERNNQLFWLARELKGIIPDASNTDLKTIVRK